MFGLITRSKTLPGYVEGKRNVSFVLPYLGALRRIVFLTAMSYIILLSRLKFYNVIFREIGLSM